MHLSSMSRIDSVNSGIQAIFSFSACISDSIAVVIVVVIVVVVVIVIFSPIFFGDEERKLCEQ